MTPTAAPHPCGQPGCSAVVPRGARYCDVHLKARRKADDDRRGSSTERGYDQTWRRVRAAHLSRHPLCVLCQAEGRLTPATVVDHIISINERPDLRLDSSNHRAMCKRHHDQRTGRDQAWGRGK